MGLNLNLVAATVSITPRFSFSIFKCGKFPYYKDTTNNAFETVKT